MISPDSRAQRARCQAEIPPIALCRFPGPALPSARSRLVNTPELKEQRNAIVLYVFGL
jgi:hypothetical protein